MTFSWVDYLIVARHLAEHSTTSGYAEGCLRSVISRAYYAALNTTRNLLRDQWGIEVPETVEIHQCFVNLWLRLSFGPPGCEPLVGTHAL